MTDYSELVKRLRYAGDRAAFEPHMHHEAADAIEALQREVLAAEARGLDRAAVVAASDVPKDCGWGPGAGIAVRIRALITPEMRAALEQEQGNG